jgi:hypothetical protein
MVIIYDYESQETRQILDLKEYLEENIKDLD